MNDFVNARIFVAGHRGMVGSAILRHLQGLGCRNVVTRTRDGLNLLDQAQVRAFFKAERFDQIYLAAAKVGGIHANHTYPADFLYDNLVIETNVIHAAHAANVPRLLFLGSSCIYPRDCPQPMKEEYLLTGPLEPTNEPYAIAKIAGIKLCEAYNRQHGRDYRSVMPTNLYGPNDNFHPENSHVVPALLRRFHEAVQDGKEEVVVWGSGNALREFLYVDDLAAASVHVMNLPEERYRQQAPLTRSHLNVGSGHECSIRELAEAIARTTNYTGEIGFDERRPDGAPRKLLDLSRIKQLGWTAGTPLALGLEQAYRGFLRIYLPESARTQSL